MRLNIDVQGLKELQATLAGFSDRRMNAAVATALTKTAVDIRQVVRDKLPVIFDRPTGYTLNSMFVKPATAEKLEALMYFKDDRATSNAGTPATYYLKPSIDGGVRRIKRFERALQLSGNMPAGWFVVPGAGARLDANGNISKGQIIQILSQLRIQLVAGSNRNMSFDPQKQITAQRKAGGRFFVIQPGTKGAAPGVYQREFTGRQITPVMLFTKSAIYRRRFDFDDITRREAEQRLPKALDAAIADQLARLQAGAGAQP
ncbi:hypothetical protein [Acidovorax sp.]|uniref:hypothetical protein n=1 Tax=Acidovorax sp. TaxID=1872122 RepID=UPI00258AFED1|nr:hypothetical protein [Acidovorax sp.]